MTGKDMGMRAAAASFLIHALGLECSNPGGRLREYIEGGGRVSLSLGEDGEILVKVIGGEKES